MMSDAVRIPMPDDAELPSEVRDALAALPKLNLFRMLANAPGNFQPLFDFALSLATRMELDMRRREIAVLRVIHLTRSRYEWVQHLSVAKSFGVSESEVESIAGDGPVTALDEEANLLCRVADEITRDVRLSDEALAAVLARFGRRQAMELILCCSYFNMIARICESTRVELETAERQMNPSVLRDLMSRG
jgi:4-carboxymuconolactone decarboxylase